MSDLVWSDFSWRPHYGGSAALGAAVFGVALCVVGGLYLAYATLGRGRGPLQPVVRVISLPMLDGLMSGLITALVVGLIGGLAFEVTQALSETSQFILPGLWVSSALLGLGWGTLVGCAPWLASRLPRGPVVGLAIGLAVGLAVFRFIFGRAAGFGHELDDGVGTEVGFVFGVLGGLAGAVIGALVRGRATPGASPAPRGAWPRPLIDGMLGGLVAGVAFAGVGALAGWFTLILPYYGRSPECDLAAPTPCTSYSPSPTMQLLGLLYGLGIFGMAGLLVGGLAGALASKVRATSASTMHWAGLTAGLAGGLASGLAAGIQHLDIGGPPIPVPGFYIVPDPVAASWALGLGLAAGLALGVTCGVAWHRVAQRPEQRTATVGAIAILVGFVVLLLPLWFTPVTGVGVF